jgi:hypothetical protein
MAWVDGVDSEVPIKDYLEAHRIRGISRRRFSEVGAGLR